MVEQTPRRSAERRAPYVIGREAPRSGASRVPRHGTRRVRRSAPAVLGASSPRIEGTEDETIVARMKSGEASPSGTAAPAFHAATRKERKTRLATAAAIIATTAGEGGASAV